MTIQEALTFLNNSIYTVIENLKVEVWVSPEPVLYENRLTGKHLVLKKGDKWGSLFDCGWFHFTGNIPEISKSVIPVLLIDVNGELLLVDDNGYPIRGLTNKSSTFDYKLGEPVKRVFRLPEAAKAGDSFDYWADAGCNDLFGELKENGTLKQADIALCNEGIRCIYYDFEFLINLMNGLPEEDQLHKRIETVLEGISSSLADLSAATLTSASGILRDFLEQQPPRDELLISAIGHSHLDLAWLWPIRETRRKIGRTLSTVFELMERYPDYIYGCSQPQLLAWVKEDYPDLYRRFKQKVTEGRIEIQGAMWVESDTNMPTGESLVRQIIVGKRFWKEEFNIEIDNLWLPDVFGYSGALPQILKQTGIKYFSTMKLSWNTINKFPFFSFHWKGIDGSTVLAHMLPEETYNGPARPKSVLKIIDNYNEKNISNHALMVFGIGDGGGGPGAEHLERLGRMKCMAGLTMVKQEKISDFFPVWASESEKFPTWEGELYLEKHQGTYTTEGLSKWYNRKMELNLRKMEFTSVLAMNYSAKNYPAKKLEELWKETLLYQFHDILPGSSIKRVYDESWKRYSDMLAETELGIWEAEQDMIKCAGLISEETTKINNEECAIMAFNSLSWKITKWVFLNNRWTRITIPSMGYAVQKIGRNQQADYELTWDSSFMENQLIRIEFEDDGSILSVFDKENDYEVLVPGSRGNKFTVYNDTGDVWDFPEDYRSGDIEQFYLSESTIEKNGPELINHQLYRYSKSIIRQDIVLTDGERRIDFCTKISWSNPGRMIRTSFPVDIPSGIAKCEVQFGAIERPVHSNTSWDAAKDEISAHTWVDISNNGYGAAILNDSKYGHRVKDRILDLCLLRSVPYPGPVEGFTDLGEQNFTYSLFPHQGNYSEGGVVQAAHELNSPPSVYQIKEAAENCDRSFFSTGDPSLIISSIKKAEDSDDVIVRLYESAGKRVSTWLKAEMLQPGSKSSAVPVKATLVNLLEEFQKSLSIKNGRIELKVKPYGIITIRLG
jgi:alpha-mannosidase